MFIVKTLREKSDQKPGEMVNVVKLRSFSLLRYVCCVDSPRPGRTQVSARVAQPPRAERSDDPRQPVARQQPHPGGVPVERLDGRRGRRVPAAATAAAAAAAADHPAGVGHPAGQPEAGAHDARHPIQPVGTRLALW